MKEKLRVMTNHQALKEKQFTFEQKDACFDCEYEEVCPLEHGIYICLKDEATKKNGVKK